LTRSSLAAHERHDSSSELLCGIECAKDDKETKGKKKEKKEKKEKKKKQKRIADPTERKEQRKTKSRV
jgi:Tol biopolymer transport system component